MFVFHSFSITFTTLYALFPSSLVEQQMHKKGKQRTRLFAKYCQVYETNILNFKIVILLSPKFRAHKFYRLYLLSAATTFSERSLIFPTWVRLSVLEYERVSCTAQAGPCESGIK